MLEIKNLTPNGGKKILQGINLRSKRVKCMPSWAPTARARARCRRCWQDARLTKSQGEILYQGKDLLEMAPEERAREGIFMAFQYPVEIPGVNNTYFLKAALNAVRKHEACPNWMQWTS